MSITYCDDIAETRSEDTAPRYGRDSMGYGRKIPTRHWVRLAGETRWRRVYVMQFSNAGSAYIVRNGRDEFLRDTDLG